MKKRLTIGVVAFVALVLGVSAFWAFGNTYFTPAVGGSTPPPTQDDTFGVERLEMVETQLAGRDIHDQRVLDIMRQVPRQEFVPQEDRAQAYQDRPLPIGFGQTISQPYIVALMTQLMAIKRGDRVLEIGTGSGYQAAILAGLTDEVWTVEIIPDLAKAADDRLKRLGYTSVHVRTGDGYYGWPENGPFDAIVVTAAPDHVPPPLVQQLKEDGRLVIPVGPPGGYQTLWRLTKRNGQVISENITGVLFVPLMGGTR